MSLVILGKYGCRSLLLYLVWGDFGLNQNQLKNLLPFVTSHSLVEFNLEYKPAADKTQVLGREGVVLSRVLTLLVELDYDIRLICTS